MVDYSNIPRDSRRVPLETRVQFKFDRFDGFISEYSANISPGGLFLRTRVPQPPGTVLDFEFRLGDGFELIRGRGEVVWNRLEDEGAARPAGMGLRFISLAEGSKELIYRIVDQHILHGGTPFDVTQRPPDPVPPPPTPIAVPVAVAVPPLPPPPPSPPFSTGTATLAAPTDPGANPWPRPAPPPAAREAFDLAPPLSTPDSSSWLPALDDGGLGGTQRSALLEPEAAAPPEAPAMFGATFGHAAVRPPRRKLPWILLAAGVLVAAALFLLRDSLMGWMGLGGDEVVAQAAPAPRHPKGPRRARPGVPVAAPASAISTSPASGTTDLAASPPATSPPPVAAPTAAAAPAPAPPPAPSPAQKSVPTPAPVPAPGKAPAQAAPFPAVPEDAGTPLTAVEKITFEAAGGGTDVIIWGNGAIPASVYTQSRIDGNPPRELFRLSGIRQPFAKARIVVGTQEVLQIRTGIHPGAHGNELHVVLDLAHPNVAVTQVEAGPQRLRIHLQRK
ncbi:MAG TPA: TIGR02266 family protein [Thermoanaerobaculia bacterium]|jgi:uncharacterized protein (TIGR02266 family)